LYSLPSQSLITIAYIYTINLFFYLIYHLVYFVQAQILDVVEQVQHVLRFEKVVKGNTQRNELDLRHLSLFFILHPTQRILTLDLCHLLCILRFQHTVHQILGHSWNAGGLFDECPWGGLFFSLMRIWVGKVVEHVVELFVVEDVCIVDMSNIWRIGCSRPSFFTLLLWRGWRWFLLLLF